MVIRHSAGKTKFEKRLALYRSFEGKKEKKKKRCTPLTIELCFRNILVESLRHYWVHEAAKDRFGKSAVLAKHWQVGTEISSRQARDHGSLQYR